MKIAITGAAGLFGYGLTQVFQERHKTYPLTRADADITRASEIEAALSKIQPDVVIHPAGIPNIDLCEEDPAQAFLVNVHGTRHVAEAARRVNARVAYISTDAVFDGLAHAPYSESSPVRPPTVYGRTKLRGEHIVRSEPESWVFRVSVLFGPGKTNFVEKGLRKLAAGEPYTVASDQIGSATYTVDAARKICEVVEAKRYGLYHLSNSGPCNRLELAQRAAEMAGLDPAKIIGKPSDQMGRRAKRLKYSVMDMPALEQAGFSIPRPWMEALNEYIASLGFPQGHASALLI
ncbi:MAG TPA: dTDP-4-dehydrorhamnose reductase [Terriglobia bacterium]|nr:dTDP-4-dehydrorhamnose reductase [Terriglobia bacterium]